MSNLTYNRNNNFKPKVQRLGNTPLPNSYESEKYVINAMVIKPNIISDVLNKTDESEFYDRKHAIMFSAISELFQRNESIDYTILGQEILQNGDVSNEFQQIGGIKYILELNRKYDIVTANYVYHTVIISNYALKRKMMAKSVELFKKAQDDTENIRDVIADAKLYLAEITTYKHLNSPDDDATNYIKNLREKIENETPHFKTGLSFIDKIIKGLYPRELTLIGGRPGGGKTSLVVQMIYNMVFKSNYKVHFLSLEMLKQEVLNRFVGLATDIAAQDLKDGNIDENQLAKVVDYLMDHSCSSLFIDDNTTVKYFEDMLNTVKMRIQISNIKVLVIDNFQHITNIKKEFKTTREKMSYVSNTLREFAKENEIAIVNLVQLNREYSKRKTKQPQIADIKETGDLEQDAHVIILIDNPEADKRKVFDDGQDANDKVDIIIAKHRDGNTGVKRVHFDSKRMKFTEIDYMHEEHQF